MADQTTATKDDKTTLVIPADLTEKFGELIELIKASKSMDDGERQYWIDVLPIMSEDQIQNLRNILDNEKKQLAQAEAAYSDGMKTAVKNVAVAFDEKTYIEKKRARQEAELKQQEKELDEEAAVLQELQTL
jgi:hypothetical protein